MKLLKHIFVWVLTADMLISRFVVPLFFHTVQVKQFVF